jgi:excisionase family DNA binding protein
MENDEMTDDDAHRLVTPAELAELWGVTRQHVYNLMKRDGLPSLSVGGRCRRFRLADAEAWLEARQGN